MNSIESERDSASTARRERAEKWTETHCPSCGMPRATDVDWKRHDEGGECASGCECEKCCSVCWDEFSCQSGDDEDAVTCYLAGSREEAEIRSEEVERLESVARGLKQCCEEYRSEIAALREAIKDFLCECVLVDKFRRYETWQITPWSMDELMKMVEEEP